MAALRTITKQPDEVLDAPVLVGRPLVLVVADVVARGLVVGSSPIDTDTSLPAPGATTGATIRLTGGTDGERYLVTAHGTLADDQVVDEELEIAVIDGTWAMPNGGVAYLTIKEFVDTFGLDEVITMTSAGDGRIDRELLIGALRAAQGIADANLAARYATPLESVPDLVKSAIADIARARLYPRGVPDGVASAAKEQTKLLERIAEGKVPLPIPTGEEAPIAAEDAPVLFRPGKRRRACW